MTSGGHDVPRADVRGPCEHMFVSPGAANVLHADLDSFYASVEQRDDRRLQGRPVIVGAGVVLAASYEAKAYGVRTAMGARQARQLCPQLAVVSPRMSAYSEASRAVFAVFEQLAPVVEALSIDEAFLDVRGLEHILGSPVEIAARLRTRIRAEVGLPITVGVARTKFLAKVASAVAKPDGLLVVAPSQELAFLHPLPVSRLWGVGRVTAAKLHTRGFRTVGDLAAVSERTLVAMLGRASGRHLHALARGSDPRPVRRRRRRRSIGAQHALGARRRSEDELATILIGLVDRVSRRLRVAQRVCRTVVLRLRFADFSRATRSHTVLEPTDRTHTILAIASRLLTVSMPIIHRRGLTLLGIALANLADQGPFQMSLLLDSGRTLDRVLDEVRSRFGPSSITRGVLIGQHPGPEVPRLQD